MVVIKLKDGEAVVGEAGAMTYMSPNAKPSKELLIMYSNNIIIEFIDVTSRDFSI
jgi:hypothetical protein